MRTLMTRSKIYLPKSKRSIKRLIFHHFGASAPAGIGVPEIRHMHIDGRKWDDIGYHGVIFDYGFQSARSIHNAGAHTWGFNRGSIGILFYAGSPVGGVTRPSDRQLQIAKEVIAEQHRYYGAGLEVLGHRDLRPTHCPGFDVPHWVKTDQIRG